MLLLGVLAGQRGVPALTAVCGQLELGAGKVVVRVSCCVWPPQGKGCTEE